MSFWDAGLPQLMNEALVPGASLAIIRGGRIAEVVSCGVRHSRSPLSVDENTVFDAASLSKPIFAQVVLQLVDQGQLTLDTLLVDQLAGYIANDPRASSISVAHALSHSSGLPNWRSLEHPLRTYFSPGERFSYSGEGFLYLQRVVEAVTGEPLEGLAQKLVFEPLGMTRSSFVWERRFEANRAYGHDVFGTPALGNKPGEANAAWSLQTCAVDYARFLIGALEGTRLRPATTQLALAPRIQVKHRGIESLELSPEVATTGVAWGLGWGLEPGAGTFFQWRPMGRSPPSRSVRCRIEARSSSLRTAHRGYPSCPRSSLIFPQGNAPLWFGSISYPTRPRLAACSGQHLHAARKRRGRRSRVPHSNGTS